MSHNEVIVVTLTISFAVVVGCACRGGKPSEHWPSSTAGLFTDLDGALNSTPNDVKDAGQNSGLGGGSSQSGTERDAGKDGDASKGGNGSAGTSAMIDAGGNTPELPPSNAAALLKKEKVQTKK